MKFFLPVCILFLFASATLSAQQDPDVLKTKISILEAERSAAFLKMTAIREAKIKEDPTLRRMHDQIISLHRKLALLLDSKKEISEINHKISKLDSEIDAVKKQIKSRKTEPEKKPESGKKGE